MPMCFLSHARAHALTLSFVRAVPGSGGIGSAAFGVASGADVSRAPPPRPVRTGALDGVPTGHCSGMPGRGYALAGDPDRPQEQAV